MGVKKLVTITVEAQIEIELPDWAANPTAKDIEDVNYCGFDVNNSDDIYVQAARTILMGYANSNNDVFGFFYDFWQKQSIENPENKSFYDFTNCYVEDFKVENMGTKTDEA